MNLFIPKLNKSYHASWADTARRAGAVEGVATAARGMKRTGDTLSSSEESDASRVPGVCGAPPCGSPTGPLARRQPRRLQRLRPRPICHHVPAPRHAPLVHPFGPVSSSAELHVSVQTVQSRPMLNLPQRRSGPKSPCLLMRNGPKSPCLLTPWGSSNDPPRHHNHRHLGLHHACCQRLRLTQPGPIALP
jgi:hypothetical protein